MSTQAQEPSAQLFASICSASVLLIGGVATVIASGEFDVATCGALAEALAVACAARVDVVVDLTGVTFMDGAGLRQVEQAAKAQQLAGRSLRVANPRRAVVRLLHAAGATHLLHC
jgi:anti-anti-sigma factor